MHAYRSDILDGMGVTLISSDAAADLRDRWLKLESEPAVGFMFQSYGWLAAVIEALSSPQDRFHFVVAADRAGEPVAAAAFVLSKHRGARILSLVDFGLADYSFPLVSKRWFEAEGGAALKAVWDAMIAACPPADAFIAQKAPLLIEGRPNPLLDASQRLFDSSVTLDMSGGVDQVLKGMSKKIVADTQRQRRRLEALGALSYVVASNPDEAGLIVQAMLEQKSHQYRLAGYDDSLQEPKYRNFYHGLPAASGGGYRAHISGLILDGKVIAAHVGGVFQDRIYWLMPSYDVQGYKAYSPGRILMLEAMRWSEANGINHFDMTIGGEQYKVDFGGVSSSVVSIAKPFTPVGRAYVLALRLSFSAKTFIKEKAPGFFRPLKAVYVSVKDRRRAKAAA